MSRTANPEEANQGTFGKEGSRTSRETEEACFRGGPYVSTQAQFGARSKQEKARRPAQIARTVRQGIPGRPWKKKHHQSRRPKRTLLQVLRLA